MTSTMTTEQPASPNLGPSVGRVVLLAGSGQLPCLVTETARQHNVDFLAYTMDKDNVRPLQDILSPDRVRFLQYPGKLDQVVTWLKEDGCNAVVFAGKVNKSIILRSLVFDARAMRLMKAQRQFNDDSIMLTLIRELESDGFKVLPQSDFLKNYFIKPGIYSRRQPTPDEERDIDFGLGLAKEMGRLDVGQTVVVSNGMVLAIEAIEGTDEAILRTKKWAGDKGGVVAKVEKPGQDMRFDIPTVGPRTLENMRKAGLTVLAVEANKTFMVEQETMIRLADRWNIVLVAR